jgi:NAD(P)-dependent dehydrogenase (short-subunit alcohol dehydrogenase family)
MVVDDARHQRQALRIDAFPGLAFDCFAYLNDSSMGDCEISGQRRRTAAVEQHRAADEEIVHGRISISPVKLFELQGKCAIVTGAGRGIGAATAELFAAAGAAVAVLDKDEGNAVRTAGAIGKSGGRALAVTCDVTDENQVEEMFAGIVKEFGALDILVNNAGIAIRKPALELPLEQWKQVIEVNLTALFTCSRIAARYMKLPRREGTPGGCIVNLASIMGLSGGVFPNASYQASKGGVVNLTRSLALEWAAERIRVNAVAPTFVKTDLTAPIFSNPALLEEVRKHTPLGMLPEAGDIAAAILFLASPAARCITGITLPVDSGYLAR